MIIVENGGIDYNWLKVMTLLSWYRIWR